MLTSQSRRRSHQTEVGASFTEYVVLLAGILVVVIAGLVTMGSAITALVATVGTLIQSS